MAEKVEYTRNQLISSLLQIKHHEKGATETKQVRDRRGRFSSKTVPVKRESNEERLGHYVGPGLAAAKTDSDLLGHFVAWNHVNGKVRDAQVALPVIALRHLTKADADLAENAVAHMCSLGPRELVRAYDFNKYVTGTVGVGIAGGHRSVLEDGIRRYILARQANNGWFDRTVLQHRDSLRRLYRIAHLRPSDRAKGILFENVYPAGSVFEVVRNLRNMSPREAAGAILTNNIPLQVAVGSVANARNKEIVLALIEGMTGNQLITNSAMLERLGVATDPVLKASFDAAIERAKTSKRGVESLKGGQAAKQVKDTAMAEKLGGLQETKLKQLGGIEGDWLVMGDRSGSMAQCVDLARNVASLIAQQVKGKVYLIFFNTTPTFFDVTGKTYEQILAETRRVSASGGTSIGCGVDYLRSRGIIVQGIAIASDGGDNTAPSFVSAYKAYTKELGVEPTVYLFHMGNQRDNILVPPAANSPYSAYREWSCPANGIQLETFELGMTVDRYALPNIVATLRANRYALFDEVMAMPFLTFEKVFQGVVA